MDKLICKFKNESNYLPGFIIFLKQIYYFYVKSPIKKLINELIFLLSINFFYNLSFHSISLYFIKF